MNGVKLSYVHKLLLAADPFAAIRTNFRAWGKKLRAKGARHLTSEQREDISTDLQESATGPISMTAAASDKESISYQGEIANVLEETGFEVKIDNAKTKPSEQQIPAGVEVTIKDATVRPVHAYWIVRAFRRAGVAIATRINGQRRKNNTLYITVGANGASGIVSPTIQTAASWQSKVRATVLKKWKMKFAGS